MEHFKGGAGRGGDFVDLFFGGRPCDHAATISSSSELKVPQIQFIDSGWIFLLCVQRQVPTVHTVQFSVEIPQVPLKDWFLTRPLSCNARCIYGCQVRGHLCRGAEAVSLGPVQKTIDIVQLQFIDKVFDVCCAGPASSGAVCDETVELPQLQPVEHGHCRCMPVVCNDRCLVVQECGKLRRLRSCSTSDNVVDVPVGAVHRRFGRPFGHAATVATVEVPQIQLSPESVDIPVRNRDGYSTLSSGGYGGDEGFLCFF